MYNVLDRRSIRGKTRSLLRLLFIFLESSLMETTLHFLMEAHRYTVYSLLYICCYIYRRWFIKFLRQVQKHALSQKYYNVEVYLSCFNKYIYSKQFSFYLLFCLCWQRFSNSPGGICFRLGTMIISLSTYSGIVRNC